jgi:hypothetical protein
MVQQYMLEDIRRKADKLGTELVKDRTKRLDWGPISARIRIPADPRDLERESWNVPRSGRLVHLVYNLNLPIMESQVSVLRGHDPYREWTDATGQFRRRAAFLSAIDNTVRLLQTNQDVMDVDLAKLSKDDQEYLRKVCSE